MADRKNSSRREDRQSSRRPTQQEIRRACRRIQHEWSESERKRRRVVKPIPWTVPTVKPDLPTR